MRSMRYQYHHNQYLTTFSRTNRKKQTDAEKLLWFRLRNKQLAGYKFRRQYPVQNYILDFYCVEKRLAVELDGSQHMNNKIYDEKRDTVLQKYGIETVRFWDNDVLQKIEAVVSQIAEKLSQ